MAAEEATYDLVILDPPAFAKSRRHIDTATKAYQRININALQLLRPGGILATSSCSQAVDEDAFVKIIQYSARKAGAPLRQLYRGTQPPDHPILESMPETHYLKFFIFQRLDDEVPA
jgi:23S rRNA (cytosine1962-C5)-methyltransferase